MNKQKGFTLIEMLVVIAIIAILAGAVMIAINPVEMMKKSRDATRLSDMDTLRNAITLAITEQEIVLRNGVSTNSVTTNNRTANCVAGYVQCDLYTGKTAGLTKYIPVLPVDPTNATVGTITYAYYFASTTNDFELNTILESNDNDAKMLTDGGNDPDRYEVGTSLTIMSP